MELQLRLSDPKYASRSEAPRFLATKQASLAFTSDLTSSDYYLLVVVSTAHNDGGSRQKKYSTPHRYVLLVCSYQVYKINRQNLYKEPNSRLELVRFLGYFIRHLYLGLGDPGA